MPRARKYAVSVRVDGVRHYGGYFDSLQEAEAAAIALRLRLMTNNLADRAGVAAPTSGKELSHVAL